MRTGRRRPSMLVARQPASERTAERPSLVPALQDAVGNRATARLLQRRAPKGYPGLKIGRNKLGSAVTIKRELGSLGGYADRLQAIAAARLANVDPAAVGRDAKGRWHAFEVSLDFHGGSAEAGAPLAEVYGLPTAKDIPAQQATVATMKAHGGSVAGKLNDASKALYALILGVDGGEVLLNKGSKDRRAGKVNITTDLANDRQGRLGSHGRESQQGEGFDPTVPSAFELSPDAFTSAARAQAVMFHELCHLEDYELTRRLVSEYEAKGNSYVGGGLQRFDTWVRKNAKPAEAQLASDIAYGAQATTEARAYVKTFIAAFDLGAGAEAAVQLVAYAKGMSNGKIAIPAVPERNPVLLELKKELAAYRGRLGRTERTAFDAAVASAVKENPKSWLAGIKHR